MMGAIDDQVEEEDFHPKGRKCLLIQEQKMITKMITPADDPRIHQAGMAAQDAGLGLAVAHIVWSNIALQQSSGRNEKLEKIENGWKKSREMNEAL